MSVTGFNRRRREHGETKQRHTEGQEIEAQQAKKTKKEIMAELDQLNIEYNPRDRKDNLIALLGGE